jgi:hypothetical protein
VAPRSEVVTSNVKDRKVVELQQQLATLEKKAKRLQAIARCALAKVTAANVSLDHRRMPDGDSKQRGAKAASTPTAILAALSDCDHLPPIATR